MVSDEELKKYKKIFENYKGKLRVNRIDGVMLLQYLQAKYVLFEIYEQEALQVVIDSVNWNIVHQEKLPENTSPIPRCFYLEKVGNGEKFYNCRNNDEVDRIFIGIDMVTGFFTVEGSTLLYDELNAIRGVDEKDLQNYVIVAQYIMALEKLNMLDASIKD